MSSAFALAATTASSPGSDRVTLNGFGAGAGPSPRIEGAGADCCAESKVVASAAVATRAASNCRQRVFMAGFYQPYLSAGVAQTTSGPSRPELPAPTVS